MMKFAQRFAPAGFDRKAFYPCYGLAECTLFVSGTDRLEGSAIDVGGPEYMRVGELDDSTTIAIVDVASGHLVSSEREVGEIWVRSASAGAGYYMEPALTKAIFYQECEKGNGYVRTGDLGFVYDGGLYIVGRLKNIIKVRGRSLHAEDIEDFVLRMKGVDGISKCAAFGVEFEYDEKLVVLLEREHGPGTLTKDVSTIASAICEVFGIVPAAVRVIAKGTLPLTTSGKLQRTKCRNNFVAGLYDH